MNAIFNTILDMNEYVKKNKKNIEQLKCLFGLTEKQQLDLVAVYKKISFEAFSDMFTDNLNQETVMLVSYFLNSPQFFLGSIIRSWHTLDAHLNYPNLVPLAEFISYYSDSLPKKIADTVAKSDVIRELAEKKITEEILNGDWDDLLNYDTDDDEAYNQQIEEKIPSVMEEYINTWRKCFVQLPKTNDACICNEMEKRTENRVLLPNELNSSFGTLFNHYPFLTSTLDIYERDKGKYTTMNPQNLEKCRKQCFVSVGDAKLLQQYIKTSTTNKAKKPRMQTYEYSFKSPFFEKRNSADTHPDSMQINLGQYIEYHENCLKDFYAVDDVERFAEKVWELQVLGVTEFIDFVNAIEGVDNAQGIWNAYKFWADSSLRFMSCDVKGMDFYRYRNIDFYSECNKSEGEETEIRDADERKILYELILEIYLEYLKRNYGIAVLRTNGFAFPSMLHLEWAVMYDWPNICSAMKPFVEATLYSQNDFLDFLAEHKKIYPVGYVEFPPWFWNMMNFYTGNMAKRMRYNTDEISLPVLLNWGSDEEQNRILFAKCTEKITIIEKTFLCVLHTLLGPEIAQQKLEELLQGRVLPLEFKADNPVMAPITFKHQIDYVEFLNYTIITSFRPKKVV